MATRWFPAPYCPREATCSMDNALTPSVGPKIQSMEYPSFPDPIVAEIRHFPNGPHADPSAAGYNWEKCAGQGMEIAQHVDIYSVIGVQFGGDGRAQFDLPNLMVDGNTDYYICLNGEKPGFVGP